MKLVSQVSRVFFFLCFPISANAYIGPGAGLSAIGSALALAAVIILFAVGFMWYPLKRMLRRQNSDEGKDTTNAHSKSQSSDESSGRQNSDDEKDTTNANSKNQSSDESSGLS